MKKRESSTWGDVVGDVLLRKAMESGISKIAGKGAGVADDIGEITGKADNVADVAEISGKMDDALGVCLTL